MKARNLLKKNRAGSGFGRKKRRDSEIKRKKQAGRRNFENPIVDPIKSEQPGKKNCRQYLP